MMKRLLQIVLNAEGTFGGAQKHVAQILAGLEPSRYVADVVTWDIPLFVDYLKRRHVDTLAVTGSHMLDIGMVRRLATHIRVNKYDLVHTHGDRAGVIGRLAALHAGAPAVVWTCHGTDNKLDRKRYLASVYTRVLRWLGRRTNVQVAVSNSVRDWLVARGIPYDSVVVIPNCVDLEEFRPRPPAPQVLASLGLKTVPHPQVVGTVCRLSPPKGVDCLIEAARFVLDRRPGVQFVIVGGGPLLDDLRRLAHALEVAGNVVFAGERRDVPDILATFDVAVLPSLSEGFGYFKLEAMASAKPLVCSDIEVFRDVVCDGHTGLVFPAGSAPDLGQAILRLLDDPEESERLARAGFDLVRDRFSLPAMQRRTVDLYDSILADRNTR